ncbi:MAG: KDO2-lipid IV(A) lauroyltransferase [Candidatus Azotimanducaceae bacterium]|jgi:KDO2-lipid IV(A) lauroyltransferase
MLRLIGWLPFNWQLSFGASLGSVGYWLATDRRRIAETNIRLCFPQMSGSEQSKLVKEIFRNNGRGVMETSFSWSGRIADLENRIDISGLNHLQAAFSRGKGVMLLGMHFSTLDLCGAALAQKIPFDVMYRRNKDVLLEAVMRAGRTRNFPSAIERSDVRSVIKALKAGRVVWYGPDQDYGRKHSVFAPFFGINTASIKATARIAAITGAAVIVFQHRRTEDNRYVITLSEPLVNFPSGQEVADAARVNQLVEDAVRQAPAQYWWLHRRFKTRPEGEARPY